MQKDYATPAISKKLMKKIRITKEIRKDGENRIRNILGIITEKGLIYLKINGEKNSLK